MPRKSVSVALPVIAALSAATAQAVPTYYYNDPGTDRAAFQAAAGSLSLESFEDAFASASSQSFPVAGPQAFTVSATGVSLFQDSFPRLVTDGSSALGFSEDPSSTLTFTFNSPITAFGLDVNDLNFGTMSFADNLGNSLVDVLVGDNGSTAGGPSFQNLQFFGVTNPEPFTSVILTFTNNTPSTGSLAVDRLEFAVAAVPAPATLVLLGLGLAGLGLGRRRLAA